MALAAESITLIGGSTSISTVINPVKAAFEKKTGITLNATAAGSKVALAKLDAGECDVATAGHTQEELFGNIKKDNTKLKNPLESINVIKLAEPAGYSVIVNPANPVAKLSKEQLEGIFTGKITNWKEVGGKDAAILCVVSNLSPGSNAVFSKVFLGDKKISIDTLDASNAADLRQNIATNHDSIGYLPSAMIDPSVKGVETLPMKSSPIIMLTIGKPSPKVQKLADFILGEGKQYIK
jgi:phosphate transport system substrate-binding protein